MYIYVAIYIFANDSSTITIKTKNKPVDTLVSSSQNVRKLEFEKLLYKSEELGRHGHGHGYAVFSAAGGPHTA